MIAHAPKDYHKDKRILLYYTVVNSQLDTTNEGVWRRRDGANQFWQSGKMVSQVSGLCNNWEASAFLSPFSLSRPDSFSGNQDAAAMVLNASPTCSPASAVSPGRVTTSITPTFRSASPSSPPYLGRQAWCGSQRRWLLWYRRAADGWEKSDPGSAGEGLVVYLIRRLGDATALRPSVCSSGKAESQQFVESTMRAGLRDMRGLLDPQADMLRLVLPESYVPAEHPLHQIKPLAQCP